MLTPPVPEQQHPARAPRDARVLASLAQGFALCRTARPHVLAQRGPERSSRAGTGPPGTAPLSARVPFRTRVVSLAQGFALCRKALSHALAQRGPGRSLLGWSAAIGAAPAPSRTPVARGVALLAHGFALYRKALSHVLAQRGPGRSLLGRSAAIVSPTVSPPSPAQEQGRRPVRGRISLP